MYAFISEMLIVPPVLVWNAYNYFWFWKENTKLLTINIIFLIYITKIELKIIVI